MNLPAQETGLAIVLRKVGPNQVLHGSTELRERRTGRREVWESWSWARPEEGTAKACLGVPHLPLTESPVSVTSYRAENSPGPHSLSLKGPDYNQT